MENRIVNNATIYPDGMHIRGIAQLIDCRPLQVMDALTMEPRIYRVATKLYIRENTQYAKLVRTCDITEVLTRIENSDAHPKVRARARAAMSLFS